jgi:eukaryotic-like serine/threonine-protein kinase
VCRERKPRSGKKEPAAKFERDDDFLQGVEPERRQPPGRATMPASDPPVLPATQEQQIATPPTPDDPLAGTQFRTCSALGAGGTGEVVEAEHVVLRKRVVIKLLHRELAGKPIQVERMRLEAEALGRISPHPHIVEVHDVGTTKDGRPFIVMERLRGSTLQQELRRRGHLPVEEALDVCGQILAGLEAAHGTGIIHRDIKPANLFLCDPVAGTTRRTLKILDFGIAKVIAPENAAAPRPLALATIAGSALGTPRFIAPEQAFGEPVDARADLYAVGAVLYTMLVGHDPFAHVRAVSDLLFAHLDEVPDAPSKAAPQPIGEALDAIVLKALAKRPDDRFRDAAELAAALRVPSARIVPRWRETEPLAPDVGGRSRAPSGAAPVQTIAGRAPATRVEPAGDGEAHRVSLPVAVAIVAASVLASALMTFALVQLLGAKAPEVEYGAARYCACGEAGRR